MFPSYCNTQVFQNNTNEINTQKIKKSSHTVLALFRILPTTCLPTLILHCTALHFTLLHCCALRTVVSPSNFAFSIAMLIFYSRRGFPLVFHGLLPSYYFCISCGINKICCNAALTTMEAESHHFFNSSFFPRVTVAIRRWLCASRWLNMYRSSCFEIALISAPFWYVKK